MSDKVNDVCNSEASVESPSEIVSKKEKTTKKEKRKRPIAPPIEEKQDRIIEKYYSGSDIRRLPKLPKAMYKDLDKIPPLTEQQAMAYLSLIATGSIEDKFGLEIGADTKLKALDIILKQAQANKREKEIANVDEEIHQATNLVFKVRESNFNESNINDPTPEEQEGEENADTNANESSE